MKKRISRFLLLCIVICSFLASGCRSDAPDGKATDTAPGESAEANPSTAPVPDLHISKKDIDLFAYLDGISDGSVFHLLDCVSGEYLLSSSERLPGFPEQFFGIGEVSDIYLLDAAGTIKREWKLSVEGLECSGGAIAEDGVFLFCQEADGTFQSTSAKYQLRYYANSGTDYTLLASGECEQIGAMALLENDKVLYTLHEIKNSLPVLQFHVITNEGKEVFSSTTEISAVQSLEDRVSVKDGEYFYAIMFYGGQNNAFFRGSSQSQPEEIRFSDTDDKPTECIRYHDALLTLKNRQKPTGEGIVSYLRLYDPDGAFLAEQTYGEEFLTNGFSSLFACDDFCVTRAFDQSGHGQIIPIILENDTIYLLESIGDGSYQSLFAKDDAIYAYDSVKTGRPSCSVYRIEE